jgi:demethylmenaquinone methyltransferase/2-methoxy-6-polyprenyl-1,4-benzoquinol methylase/phosphoethanolamine N-methyltransferase
MKMHTHSHANTVEPATRGNVIRWAYAYDTAVKVLSFNRDRAFRDKTISLATIEQGQTVLDVGCGTGELTLRAKAAAGPSGMVFGIDPAPEMIDVAQRKVARKHVDVKFQVGVIEALDFPDQTFDVVLSSLMMHHLPDDLKREGLREIYRILKPGGHLLIVDMKRREQSLHHMALSHLMHLKARGGIEDLMPLVQSIGFSKFDKGDLRFMGLGYLQAWR